MSLYTVRGVGWSIHPTVWVKGDHLFARTSYPVQALTLFSYSRHLHVDRAEKMIDFEVDRFWMTARRHVIPFARVHYIESGYGKMGTALGYTREGWGATDIMDGFHVGLVLRDPEEYLALFRFVGEGAVETGVEGVLYGGDQIVDCRGGHHEEYAFFVEKLQEFLRVPVGSQSEAVPDRMGIGHRCSICRRPSTAKAERCWHCGSPVEAIVPC